MPRHRHYYRSTCGGSCVCGAFEPGTEDYDAVMHDREIIADERERITGAIRGLASFDGPRHSSSARASEPGPYVSRAAVLAIVNPKGGA